jgi:hypothetical protein
MTLLKGVQSVGQSVCWSVGWSVRWTVRTAHTFMRDLPAEGFLAQTYTLTVLYTSPASCASSLLPRVM